MFDFDVRDDRELYDDEPTGTWQDRAAADALADPIAGLARRPALILSPTTTVAKALERLGETEHEMALVSSHGYLLGALTEKQLVRHLLEASDAARATPVWRVMRVEPETLKESDSVGYAVHELCRLRLSAMPVLHTSGTLAGLLENRDLVPWLAARTAPKPATLWDTDRQSTT